jgi:hypothetical protein
MERYKNLGGKSGVSAYEIGSDSITVQFTTGSVQNSDKEYNDRRNSRT